MIAHYVKIDNSQSSEKMRGIVEAIMGIDEFTEKEIWNRDYREGYTIGYARVLEDRGALGDTDLKTLGNELFHDLMLHFQNFPEN